MKDLTNSIDREMLARLPKFVVFRGSLENSLFPNIREIDSIKYKDELTPEFKRAFTQIELMIHFKKTTNDMYTAVLEEPEAAKLRQIYQSDNLDLLANRQMIIWSKEECGAPQAISPYI